MKIHNLRPPLIYDVILHRSLKKVYTRFYLALTYGLYQKQKEYAQIDKLKESQVKSGMIYGSMYDAVMNWALYGTDKTDANKVTAASTSHNLQATGLATKDVIKNIYDLGNNLREWTSEALSAYNRVGRGR